MFIDYKFRNWNKFLNYALAFLIAISLFGFGPLSFLNFDISKLLIILAPISMFIILFARFKKNDEITDKILLETRGIIFTGITLSVFVLALAYMYFTSTKTNPFDIPVEKVFLYGLGAIAYGSDILSQIILIRKLRNAGFEDSEIRDLGVEGEMFFTKDGSNPMVK